MDDESSLLKLKPYIFPSTDAEQQQDHRQLSVKDKKCRILTGRLTYASGLMLIRNPYGLNIKPSKSSKRLGTAPISS